MNITGIIILSPKRQTSAAVTLSSVSWESGGLRSMKSLLSRLVSNSMKSRMSRYCSSSASWNSSSDHQLMMVLLMYLIFIMIFE